MHHISVANDCTPQGLFAKFQAELQTEVLMNLHSSLDTV